MLKRGPHWRGRGVQQMTDELNFKLFLSLAWPQRRSLNVKPVSTTAMVQYVKYCQ